MGFFSIFSHVRACRELVQLLTSHRQLTIEMTKREIFDRYIGQIFGVFWAVGHPLFLMALFVFIFSFVFKLKMGGTAEMPFDYTTYLLAGLVPWMAFQEGMIKGSNVIVANTHLVKQIVFPIEVLPVKGVLTSVITMVISLIVLTLYVLISFHRLPWTYALLPVLIFLQLLCMIGISYLLSSVGVFFKDLKDFVMLFSIAGLYLIPVFYLPVQVPRLLRPILYLNPFSYAIWCYQDVLYFGKIVHLWSWAVFSLESIGIFYFGFLVFRKLRIMFGNVL